MGRRYAREDRAATGLPLNSLRAEIAGLRVTVAALRLTSLAFKAGFDPDQARHPKGSGRISGRWRRVTGRKPLQVDIPGPKKKPAGAGSPRTPPKSRRLKLPKPGIGHNGGPPLEDPPELPKRDPGTTEGRNRVAKRMARWLLTALSRAPDPRIRLVAHAIQAVGWLTGAFDPIETYLDEPKSLDELRRAVEGEKGRRGTDVHHIVEKEAAYQDGFTTRQIEGPANLVRIPRYKHHEINGWYQRRNPDFDGLSPRNYLRGRSWNERFEVGLDALVEQGVLKP